jgi:hypothetical protein
VRAGYAAARAALTVLLLLGTARAAAPPSTSATSTPPTAPAPAANPAAAPAPDSQEPPRKSYNQARAAFTSHDLGKAETGFLAARDHAEGDDEVRYRAAFNLALTYAQKADGLVKEKPQEALAALQQSAAWFRDAVHGRPADPDARYNLEVVLRRIQQLADQLNKGQNTLEARLARVIQDQRTLLDRIRALLSRVNQGGAAAEPLNFQGEFDDAATFERTLLSDAGAILDLAGEQRDHIAQKAEPQRTDEERGKLIQLQNLEHYLNLGRGTLADVARLLRRLQGDKAHRQADVAVTQLKRALEQLQDPVTVLKGLVADQTMVHGQTRALDELRKGNLRIPIEAPAGGATPDKTRKAEAPPWLTAAMLGEQQKDLQPRTSELLARLQAGVEHAGKQGSDEASAKQPSDPREAAQRRRIIEAAQQAIPLLQQGVASMEQATGSLQSDQLPPAAQAQVEALTALLKALERFSGIRDLIELAYAEQTQAVALLTPGKPDDKAGGPDLSKLSTQERAKLLRDGVIHNQDRLARLKGLFADELAALQAAPQAPANASGGGESGEKEKQEAEKQRYTLAEQKRQLAEAAVNQLGALLGKGGAMQASAEQGRKHLAELRRLFFTIVEHLKELLRDQTETHDGTSSAQASRDEAEKLRKLGPLVDRQQGHAALGKELAEALAAQADQAQNASEPQAKQAQKPLADAAEEVRKAQTAMDTATQTLREDQKKGQAMSFDLEAPLEQQKQAMAHLEAAIRILEPPEQKQQKQQNQQQNQDQQISQEQAARRLQAIREREAERRRKQQQPSRTDPVEKDW